MGSSSVVVGLVLGHHEAQVSFAEDQHPVGHLRPGGEPKRFGISVDPRATGRDLHRFDARAREDRVERCGELPGPVADQEPEVRGPVTEVHQEIPDLLRGPRRVRVRGDPQDVHVAVADLHHEQAVQALEGHRAVHVKEVDGKHRRGLRAEELPPARIGAPPRSRRDPQRPEDPADRGRADPVAELEQLALDPLVPPAVVPGGEPLDQRGDLGADRRPSRPAGIGPLPGDLGWPGGGATAARLQA